MSKNLELYGLEGKSLQSNSSKSLLGTINTGFNECNKGTIDFSKFDDEDMLNRGYDNYKYSGQILKKILHFPHVRENIFNFCKYRYR